MTQYRIARKTTRKKPAWEAQAHEAAAGLGVSAAKVSQRVEVELIRLVAEEIAKKQIARLRAQQVEGGEAPARPLSEVEKTALHEKVWMPPKKDNRP
jgi:hypothetical protein